MYCSAHSVGALSVILICLPSYEVYCKLSLLPRITRAPTHVHEGACAHLFIHNSQIRIHTLATRFSTKRVINLLVGLEVRVFRRQIKQI